MILHLLKKCAKQLRRVFVCLLIRRLIFYNANKRPQLPQLRRFHQRLHLLR